MQKQMFFFKTQADNLFLENLDNYAKATWNAESFMMNYFQLRTLQ